MLLPITTTSQSLKDIINNARDRDTILSLIADGYERFTIEESGVPVYKDTRSAAGSTTSTRVGTNGGAFNLVRINDIQLIADNATNLVLDLNQE